MIRFIKTKNTPQSIFIPRSIQTISFPLFFHSLSDTPMTHTIGTLLAGQAKGTDLSLTAFELMYALETDSYDFVMAQ